MTAKQLRLLFVTHTLDAGGARRSLSELIRNYPDICCDLVVPRRAAMTDAAIHELFGGRVNRIYRRWLPFEQCYRGRPSPREWVPSWAASTLLWELERPRFRRLARNYDAIHLNSIVLHPMISADLPFVIHVREIVDRDLARVRRNVSRARGAVFIDEATRAPFRDIALRHAAVINNPVDMTRVGPLPAGTAERIGGDPSELTIVSIVGVLMEEKGIDRVIRAFRAAPSPALRLLIVGTGPQEAALRRLAAGDSRIVFWGFEANTDGIYALSDYVIRGEAYPCVGRTIYEGLYAGCSVVIPGAETDHTLFDYERFRERVRFYPPGNEHALAEVLASLAGTKHREKRGESNAADHVGAIDAFIRDAIQP